MYLGANKSKRRRYVESESAGRYIMCTKPRLECCIVQVSKRKTAPPAGETSVKGGMCLSVHARYVAARAQRDICAASSHPIHPHFKSVSIVAEGVFWK